MIATSLPGGSGAASGDAAVVDRLARHVSALPDVQSVSRPEYNPGHTAAVVTVATAYVATRRRHRGARARHIRGSVIPAVLAGSGVRAWVGGATAASVDTTNVISRHLPLVLSTVVLFGILLLTIAFRSVVIPLASVAMTSISTGAADGVDGGRSSDGVGRAGADRRSAPSAPGRPWIPVMPVRSVGLSMDYQVEIAQSRRAWSRSKRLRRRGQRAGIDWFGSMTLSGCDHWCAFFGLRS